MLVLCLQILGLSFYHLDRRGLVTGHRSRLKCKQDMIWEPRTFWFVSCYYHGRHDVL